MIDPQDLVAVAEISERTSVSGSAVANWASRHDDFPAPVRVLKCGSLYLWSEVEVWLADRKAGELQRLERKLGDVDRARERLLNAMRTLR